MEGIEFTFDHSSFANKLEELVSNKKNFFVFVYGAHNPSTGKSWCPDCDLSQPFVKKAKEEIVFKKKEEKEILFVNIPVEKSERSDYTNSEIVRLGRIHSLIYFSKGEVMGS